MDSHRSWKASNLSIVGFCEQERESTAEEKAREYLCTGLTPLLSTLVPYGSVSCTGLYFSEMNSTPIHFSIRI